MSAPLLLLILFDGLGHELFQEHYHSFGNLSKFYGNSPKIKDGVTMVFPTTTAPNLMSIATGLYPENHGITGNHMVAYGTEANKYRNVEFSILTETDEDSTWWDNGVNVPIWTLNELSSITSNPRYSGGMAWPGSGATYRKKNIEYYDRYDHLASWYEKIDMAMDWITNEEKPANCVFLYMDEPDLILHTYGPNSDEFLRMMEKIDEIVGYLMNVINERNLTDSLNVIITADHGMMEIPIDHYNEIKDLNISENSYDKVLQNGVMWRIYPAPKKFFSVLDTLTDGASRMNYSVWVRNEFPPSAHFREGPHIAPIILLSDPGYWTVLEKPENVSVFGGHGYNNTIPSMNAVFLARGPAFNLTAQIDSIDSVDLYPLMCSILNLIPHANNGSFERVAALVKFLPTQENDANVGGSSVAVIIIAVTGSIIGLIVLVTVSHHFYKKRLMKKKLMDRFSNFSDEHALECFDDDL